MAGNFPSNVHIEICSKVDNQGRAEVQSKAKKVAFACTVYYIWEARNEKIFEGVTKQPKVIVRRIQLQVYRVIFNLYPDLIRL
ncbi:Transcriptional activator like [Actinidia chinensis var. chinensis]|uniref:Transcriptional activator like n=1 Tax=Actinidia chinensis var. chinensis TaxID=1590841 RepID=A0A2R6PHU2_ACTCC|nr:Transcriptional activator like [Actinidia chinensis var. chinensis]